MSELTGSIMTDHFSANGLISKTTLIAKSFTKTAMNIIEMNFSATAAGSG